MKKLVFLTSFLFFTSSMLAQWEAFFHGADTLFPKAIEVFAGNHIIVSHIPYVGIDAQPPILSLSEDLGETWQNVWESDAWEYITDIHFLDDLNGLACGLNLELWTTSDGGLNWSACEPPSDVPIYIDFEKALMVSPDTLFVTADQPLKATILSYDGGETWQSTLDFGMLDVALDGDYVYGVDGENLCAIHLPTFEMDEWLDSHPGGNSACGWWNGMFIAQSVDPGGFDPAVVFYSKYYWEGEPALFSSAEDNNWSAFRGIEVLNSDSACVYGSPTNGRSNNRIYFSGDFGETWGYQEVIEQEPGAPVGIRALSCSGEYCAAIGTQNWLLRTSNYGGEAETVDDFLLTIEDIQPQTFQVSPVPASLQVAFEMHGEGSYQITNLSGQHLKSGMVIRGRNTIDVSLLVSGCYVLTIIQEKGEVSSCRIVVE